MSNNKLLDELILKIKEGDTKALSELYNLTKTDIFAFAFSIVKNYHDAEDILQNTYITIHNNSYMYIHSKNAKSWIFTIVRNLSLMKIRNNKKEISITHEDLEAISKEHKEFNHDDEIILEYFLNELDIEERNIIVMYNLNGFKHKEIATLLNLPLGTVLSKYNRSIKKLKSFMKEAE